MKYVIVTPAFNEEKNITMTIKSVLSQTIKPIIWIIVDDGSTDNTAEVIKHYADNYPWIRYVYREKKNDQSYFASNVYAIQKGVENLSDIDYDYLAILDADITLYDAYYEDIAYAFENDQLLGIASGNCADRINEQLVKHLYDRRSCAKAVMVFRRECYEQLGGFIPMKYGGEDTCACFTARMNGWKTWAFHEFLVIHNKPLGMGYSKSKLNYRFRQGIGEFFLATHPLFLLLKSLRRSVKESPYIIGGLLRIAGFCYGYFIHEKRQIPDDLIKFIQREQLFRILYLNRISGKYKLNNN